MVPEDLAVWLEAVDPSTLGEVRPGLLCTRHADAMVVPKGWTLDDRREPVPRLFRVPERPVAARRPGDATARLRRPRPEDWAELALFDEPTPSPDLPAPAPLVEPEPVASGPEQDEHVDAPGESAGAPWKPRFDRSDDLDGLLTARSPLLRRAFGFDDEETGGRPG